MAYETFAQFYDKLTLNAEYEKRAEYILGVLAKHNHPAGLTLDLACGTGTLTILLKKKGVDIYGVDGSADMLSVALQKAADEDEQILFLRQRMQSLDLFGTIDTCVCTLDSINHITDEKVLQKAFDRVSLFMNPEGLFLFDVNTPYKHKNVLADNVFVFDTDEVYCVWQNTPAGDNLTEISLDFFIPEGDTYYRVNESFTERAYTVDELEAMLTKAGFKLEAVYGDLSFSAPKENEERLQIVARKKA
ncbi:MAG: methyltransferase domain-containing protein [Ruminococcaceae bacterium]|nr:methyltransferase domain-containing protein [Oscillospiraceae bacterium]